MKKLFYLLIALTLIGCKTEEPETKKFQIDPTAMVYIKPTSQPANAPMFIGKSTGHLTPLEIVKKATGLRFYNDKLGAGDWAGGFAGKDTISLIPAFLRYGTDVINPDGFGVPYLVPDFIYAYDCVIEIFRSNKDIDTIAYIPNSVLRKAESDIKNALANKDTAIVYSIFQNAFKFTPITGAEYRALKKQNLQ